MVWQNHNCVSTCKQHFENARSSLREEYLVTAKTKPSILLNGATPRLIDEWQDAPMLWDAVRTVVDDRQIPDNLYLQVPMPLTNPKYTILELVVLPDCVCCL